MNWETVAKALDRAMWEALMALDEPDGEGHDKARGILVAARIAAGKEVKQ